MVAVQREEPGPGQESVWDYPRPPRVEASDEHVVLVLGGQVVADTRESLRVLETSHPPVYYLPRSSFAADVLHPADASSFCEFKGTAAYLDLVAGGRRVSRAAWFYPDPVSTFSVLRDHVAVYPSAVDAATVDGEDVRAQAGGFYGGWITSRVVGPFKGAPGTWGW
ncbi:MAG: DUF427 domain-containing protein [Actinomycetes bacterium]